ncbi:MAG: signal recognition particle-docking protein FtsY, partial [Collinsella intestinalis]|nr:signal recognition particle-docking protein FtsY [Collinsella intestinalis]
MRVTDDLRETAARKNLKTADQLRGALAERLCEFFVEPESDIFDDTPSCVLFVGINGAGKTTTVGKIASAEAGAGKNVVIGSADTFRAAAIEQLDVWGERAGVPVIKRDRGSDPASVCYDVLDQADKLASDLVLIDTAGRLHSSPELMRELAKVVKVTRKRAESCAAGPMPVHVVLVIDSATGQNGLAQAQEFNEALGLDGIIMTKLDGTAKGGIALAVAEQLKLPIYRIGVGEQVEDLQRFDASSFCRALVGLN